jgi:hypothetical protein
MGTTKEERVALARGALVEAIDAVTRSPSLDGTSKLLDAIDALVEARLKAHLEEQHRAGPRDQRFK